MAEGNLSLHQILLPSQVSVSFRSFRTPSLLPMTVVAGSTGDGARGRRAREAFTIARLLQSPVCMRCTRAGCSSPNYLSLYALGNVACDSRGFLHYFFLFFTI